MLLGSAVYRLTPYALDLIDIHLTILQLFILIGFVVFMAVTEGYMGFQKQFSPRTAARALYLYRNPVLAHVLFAPLFCMAFFHASRRRKVVSFFVTGMILVLIVLVRTLDQPWRGIIDAGVVVGLCWGILSLFIFSILAFTNPAFSYSPEVD